MTALMESKTCPFQWGDRIDHKLFGFGTVDGEPVAVCGSDPRTYRTVSKGWTVPVKWDDPKRTATRVASVALQLVTRPDAKGGAYWSNEYRKLQEDVKTARSGVEQAINEGFRPRKRQGLHRLDEALKAERCAVANLRAFLEADEAGEHP